MPTGAGNGKYNASYVRSDREFSTTTSPVVSKKQGVACYTRATQQGEMSDPDRWAPVRAGEFHGNGATRCAERDLAKNGMETRRGSTRVDVAPTRRFRCANNA